MAEAVLIGIDVGTTNLKVMAFDPRGRPLAEASAPTPVVHPRPGWTNYDPAALWEAVVHQLREVMAALPNPAAVVSIAVASIGESGVLLDAEGEPTYPAIAWFDTRTAPQADRLLAEVGLDTTYRLTGLPPEPIYSLCKLMWLREHEADAFGRAVRWLHIADFIAWRLSGEQATDFTLASRTLALDLHGLRWNEAMPAAAGVPASLLAPLAPSGEPLGPVLPAVAEATGLPAHTTVAVGGHDHLLGALATGAMTPGGMLDSMGTAEAALLGLQHPLEDARMGEAGYSQSAMVAGGTTQYCVLNGIYTSGACIEWFLALTGQRERHGELIAEAEQVPVGSYSATFLPHLRLAGAPHPDSRARGVFMGLNTEQDTAALYRAVVEGVAMEYRYVLEPLLEHPAVPPLERILAVGGNSRNELLVRTKASVLQQPLHVVRMAEATCLGAALCGGLAAGAYTDLATAVEGLERDYTVVEPEPAWIDVLQTRYGEVYRELYGTLRGLHHRLYASQHQQEES